MNIDVENINKTEKRNKGVCWGNPNMDLGLNPSGKREGPVILPSTRLCSRNPQELNKGRCSSQISSLRPLHQVHGYGPRTRDRSVYGPQTRDCVVSRYTGLGPKTAWSRVQILPDQYGKVSWRQFVHEDPIVSRW